MSNQFDFVYQSSSLAATFQWLRLRSLLLLTPNTAAAALSKYQILILLTENTDDVALSKYQTQQLFTQNTTIAVASPENKIRLMLAKIILLLWPLGNNGIRFFLPTNDKIKKPCNKIITRAKSNSTQFRPAGKKTVCLRYLRYSTSLWPLCIFYHRGKPKTGHR